MRYLFEVRGKERQLEAVIQEAISKTGYEGLVVLVEPYSLPTTLSLNSWSYFVRLKITISSPIENKQDEFYLYEFPFNCSWMCVVSLSGNTDLILAAAEGVARTLQYAVVMASTTVEGMQKETKSLVERGYSLLLRNCNPHSSNFVELYVLPLTTSFETFTVPSSAIVRDPIDTTHTYQEIQDSEDIEEEEDYEEEDYDDEEESDEEDI
jgi:hypothetical protein